MQGSELMSADEINYILRIQHMATHGGQPYLEDFYYQVGGAGSREGELLGSHGWGSLQACQLICVACMCVALVRCTFMLQAANVWQGGGEWVSG
jgi:hypothetical protein